MARTTSKPRPIVNKYAGVCACGARVEAGAGQVSQVSVALGQPARWLVRCSACIEGKIPTPERAPAEDKTEPAPSSAGQEDDGTYTLLSGHAASSYQAAVFEHFKLGHGSRIINAVAGSGKTTTVTNALRYLPRRMTVQMLAFNTEAADQLQAGIAKLEAQEEQEVNLMYVAATRAKSHLIYVTDKDMAIDAAAPAGGS